MKKTQTLNIVKDSVVIGEVFLKFEILDQKKHYEIDVTGYVNKKYSGTDFYNIFKDLRKDVESNNGALIACYGSLRNFVISGMSCDWTNGLGGYLKDEITLDNKQEPVYKAVDSSQYGDLLSYVEQKKYMENFLKENEERIIERNKRLEAEAERIEREEGGASSIKGFPKHLL